VVGAATYDHDEPVAISPLAAGLKRPRAVTPLEICNAIEVAQASLYLTPCGSPSLYQRPQRQPGPGDSSRSRMIKEVECSGAVIARAKGNSDSRHEVLCIDLCGYDLG
jgi:hypothetical protein